MQDKLLEYCHKHEKQFKVDVYSDGFDGDKQYEAILFLIDMGIINSFEELKGYGMDY